MARAGRRHGDLPSTPGGAAVPVGMAGTRCGSRDRRRGSGPGPSGGGAAQRRVLFSRAFPSPVTNGLPSPGMPGPKQPLRRFLKRFPSAGPSFPQGGAMPARCGLRMSPGVLQPTAGAGLHRLWPWGPCSKIRSISWSCWLPTTEDVGEGLAWQSHPSRRSLHPDHATW